MPSFGLGGMAWRNIWRNRRRSLITMAAVSFALLAMTLYSGLVRGYLDGLERSILDFEVGDLQIFAPGYHDNPSIYSSIARPEEVIARLEADGFRASARYLAGGLAAAGESSAGASIRGIEVASDARVSRVAEQVGDGGWLDPSRPDEVVVGRRLARTLGIGRGSELVLLAQGADGSTANRLYQVRGVLKGVSEATDRTAVFMTAGAFRELLAYEGGAHQIIVRRPAGTTLDAAAATVRTQAATGVDVKTWRQLLPTLASMLDASQGMMYVLFFIVYIAIGIVILNAMLMAVFERVRELGMLKAIGMGPGAVLRLVLLESLMQTVIAVAAGLALSLPGVWYLATVGIDQGRLADASVGGIARDSIWRANFTGATFVGPVVALLVIVTLAVIYPAIKAARLRPVDAMRHR